MIRALVVDDEPLARERLHTLLSEHADVQIIGEREDGLSALEARRDAPFDLVFLDIQMPGLDGLEVARTWCREGSCPVIVFVTAYDQFAVEAFRLHALDYLTKPIDPERFRESLERVRKALKHRDQGELDRRIQAMLELHEQRNTFAKRLVVRDRDRYLLVSTAEIQGLEASGNYVTLHCDRVTHVMRGSLADLETRLDPKRFQRVHRSWLVNLDQVREAHTSSKGGWVLMTRGGLKIPVGERYRDDLLKVLS